MSTYLITGIAGFIGSSLARAALAQGGQVRGMDNLSTGKKENLSEILSRIDFRQADLLALAATHDACRGVDYVFHEAAIPSVPKSATAISHLKKGDYIGLRGPFGSSWPLDEAIGKDVCILAGGIGLPPLRPAIYAMLKNRKDYGKIFLLYGARSPLDLLFRVELEEWSKLYDIEVLVTVDHGDTSWKGYIGVVSELLNYINLDMNNTTAMICGPEIMMKFTIEDLLEKGFPEDNVYLSLERNMKCPRRGHPRLRRPRSPWDRNAPAS